MSAEAFADYSKLISDLYQDYPEVMAQKVSEHSYLFSKNNPFCKFGTWENFLVFDDDKLVAHASAIMDSRLPSVGIIGFVEMIKDFEITRLLIDSIIQHFKRNEIKTIHGPINFTNWQSFRFSFPEEKKPFFIEPFYRDYYADYFKKYGFKVVQKNISTIEDVKNISLDQYLDKYEIAKKDYDFHLEKNDDFQKSFKIVKDLIAEGFAKSWSYVELSDEEFQYLNQPLTKIAKHLYLDIAYTKGGEPAGFLFCVDDLYSSKKRMVAKTSAVSSSHQRKYIGSALFFRLYRFLKANQYDEILYSTMREGNDSVAKLAPTNNIYRNYEAYELTLDY
jgi:hypothetical protein